MPVLTDTCAHEPVADGSRCRFCGIASQPVNPAELASFLVDELEALGAIAPRGCEQPVAADDSCGEPAIVFDVETETHLCGSCLLWRLSDGARAYGRRDVDADLAAGAAFLDSGDLCRDCGHPDDHIDRRDGCLTCNDRAQVGEYAPCAAPDLGVDDVARFRSAYLAAAGEAALDVIARQEGPAAAEAARLELAR